MQIMITGANGFIGHNLRETLACCRPEDTLSLIDIQTPPEALRRVAGEADFVFHLAGVNRPETTSEFMEGNRDFTVELLKLLEAGKKPPVVLSSSTQAALDNPYGTSKRAAEEAVFAYGERTGAPVYVYRLTNAFGKWSRPNYNSAVATFCYNIARGLPITVNDPSVTLHLVYIDDIVREFLRALDGMPTRADGGLCAAGPEHEIGLGELAAKLGAFRDMRSLLECPDQSDPLTAKLYATYLSFLPPDDFSRMPVIHTDARGSFAELLHLGGHGQVSVNVSKPHIVKGEHWHHTKHEKFVVVSGEGVIRLRRLGDETVIVYKVCGSVPQIVDIPPGYTHSIENTGDTDMVTLMWANECYDPAKPDTFRRNVQPDKEA
ncbi:MAG: NAD-dependent epimerase/dehydratase family protein [Clostridiales bacterium]|nr:NAD-dependent epimerase/dehydratase family protein [Clostridiales bacterium]